MAKINNYYEKMTEIYRRLQDQESRDLFEARISYLLNGNQDQYIETIGHLYNDWYPSHELQEKISMIAPLKGIIVFGCGVGGRMTQRMLSFWGFEVLCFCDNYTFGKIVDGKMVLTPEEVVERYAGEGYLVIIASYEYGNEMYNELIKKGFPSLNILLPENRLLVGMRGKQYFDIFSPQSEEIYVDGGAFDGKTILDFCKWTNRNYQKIYGFEPMGKMCNVIKQKIKENHISKVHILNNAVWNKRESISFTDDGAGSCISNNGKIIVQGLDIDSVVRDDKVTFIKMDVEGSELNALKGARNTIIRNRPRLAICIYHKPLDVIELASYIIDIVPEYRFYIRHYSSHMWETVLYAAV